MSWYAGTVVADKPEQVKALLEDGNDVNDKDTIFAGRTALHYAAGNGHNECIKVLIAAGADLNAADAKKEAPLHRAALHGYSEACKLLLDAGADQAQQTAVGYTPLHWAADMGECDAIHVLLHAGSDINGLDYSGATALHWAAKNGHTAAVQMLLQHGADPSIADKGGLTPRELIHDTVIKDSNPDSHGAGCNCKNHPAFQVQRHTEEIDALLKQGESGKPAVGDHDHHHHHHGEGCDHAH